MQFNVGMKDLSALGVAAGLMTLFLFGVLFGLTEHPSVLIAGCGGGMLLLVTSAIFLHRKRSIGQKG